jgi:hypothetical protein
MILEVGKSFWEWSERGNLIAINSLDSESARSAVKQSSVSSSGVGEVREGE